ncbi:MAG: hypothetical protein ABIG84_07330 [archaeon]
MVNIYSVFSNLASQGFFDIVLPWILFLLIFFVVLEKAPFMDKDTTKKKQITIIISAILAIFAVIYIPLGAILANLFGNAGLVVAGLLVVIILLGLAGVSLTEMTGSSKTLLGILVLVVAAIVFSSSGALNLNISDSTLTLLFMAVVVIAAIIYLGNEPPTGGDGKGEKK